MNVGIDHLDCSFEVDQSRTLSLGRLRQPGKAPGDVIMYVGQSAEPGEVSHDGRVGIRAAGDLSGHCRARRR
jgi:hypothetical protein